MKLYRLFINYGGGFKALAIGPVYKSLQEAEDAANMYNMGNDTNTALVMEIK